ncbi:uncharacterized protein BCR38DRAFT_440277 [Pseudomassariella vexata]|uniref:Uncharacterized protein n=1 Tax=Pseudomassariella vexata TaxID=1141098 RepID=A0A1Y2DQE2_9PEZI|nr:uncharacterized protein BCR38DRAFT_440277 [Pseudomassariella vexata]ORY61470.1 hypothetical protein BCR38DRAFT_440277 [Pseudomassariella vexata]
MSFGWESLSSCSSCSAFSSLLSGLVDMLPEPSASIAESSVTKSGLRCPSLPTAAGHLVFAIARTPSDESWAWIPCPRSHLTMDAPWASRSQRLFTTLLVPILVVDVLLTVSTIVLVVPEASSIPMLSLSLLDFLVLFPDTMTALALLEATPLSSRRAPSRPVADHGRWTRTPTPSKTPTITTLMTP